MILTLRATLSIASLCAGLASGCAAVEGDDPFVADPGQGPSLATTGPTLLWYNRGTGQYARWFMNGPSQIVSSTLESIPGGFEPQATGNFDSDAVPDIVWRHPDGRNAIWYANSAGLINPVFDSAWKIAGAMGSGPQDIVWRNDQTGQNSSWRLQGFGVSRITTIPEVTDLNWKLLGGGNLTSRFSFRRNALIWWNQATGQIALWELDGLGEQIEFTKILATVSPQEYRPEALIDVNRDSTTDIVWRRLSDGAAVVWYMDTTSGVLEIASSGALGPAIPLSWKLVGGL
jgi:hypothetical protein